VTTTPQTIGFIGLGLMGHGMAKNLVSKGFPLNILAHKSRAPVESLTKLGARETKSGAELAKTSDIVFICVTGSPQVEDAIYRKDGILEGAQQGLIVIDCSTSEPSSTAKIGADLAAKGATLVDAPLARTPKEAEEGRLNVMVGASDAVFRTIEPALKAFAENIFHVGGLGAGHKMKLINNFLAMGQAALMAEALGAAAKAGVDLEKFCKLVSAGAVNSGIFQMVAVAAATQGKLDGLQFQLANGRKDLRYYTHMTEMLPSTSFIAEAVHQSFILADNMGLGGKFVPSLIEAQEKINGVSIVKR
jgi:3-hydroxyisobutyrate dehydrogenase-like beta-hydroxyacid dehydrogenase